MKMDPDLWHFIVAAEAYFRKPTFTNKMVMQRAAEQLWGCVT